MRWCTPPPRERVAETARADRRAVRSALMPSVSTYAVFLATGLALLVVPGPAVLYVVTRSVEMGGPVGSPPSPGSPPGTVVHIGLASAGLSSLILASVVAFDTVPAMSVPPTSSSSALRRLLTRGSEEIGRNRHSRARAGAPIRRG